MAAARSGTTFALPQKSSVRVQAEMMFQDPLRNSAPNPMRNPAAVESRAAAPPCWPWR